MALLLIILVIATVAISTGVSAADNPATGQYSIGKKNYTDYNDYLVAIFNYKGSNKEVKKTRANLLKVYKYKGTNNKTLEKKADLKKSIKQILKSDKRLSFKNGIFIEAPKYNATEVLTDKKVFKTIEINEKNYTKINNFLKALQYYNGTDKDLNALRDSLNTLYNLKTNDSTVLKAKSIIKKYLKSEYKNYFKYVPAQLVFISGKSGLEKLQKYMNAHFNHANGGSHDANGVAKTGRGDCWGLAAWASRVLDANGYKGRVVQGASKAASNHRWVQAKVNGAWVNFESSLITKKYGSKNYQRTCAAVNKIVKSF